MCSQNRLLLIRPSNRARAPSQALRAKTGRGGCGEFAGQGQRHGWQLNMCRVLRAKSTDGQMLYPPYNFIARGDRARLHARRNSVVTSRLSSKPVCSHVFMKSGLHVTLQRPHPTLSPNKSGGGKFSSERTCQTVRIPQSREAVLPESEWRRLSAARSRRPAHWTLRKPQPCAGSAQLAPGRPVRSSACAPTMRAPCRACASRRSR